MSVAVIKLGEEGTHKHPTKSQESLVDDPNSKLGQSKAS